MLLSSAGIKDRKQGTASCARWHSPALGPPAVTLFPGASSSLVWLEQCPWAAPDAVWVEADLGAAVCWSLAAEW